jgi:molecular chaperone GrpE
MNDRVDVDDIIDRFREWLDSARAEAGNEGIFEPGSNGEPDTAREFGIIDLVEEFTALRHEVKLQTKSGRGLSEQTETTLAALKQAIEEIRSVVPTDAQAAWAAGKALAEGLADLDEALHRGEREIKRASQQIAELAPASLAAALGELFRTQSWIRRRLLGRYHNEVIAIIERAGESRHELFESFLEGYGLIQNRLRRVMASEGIARIKTEGLPVDPELMTVLEVIDVPGEPAGTVVKELRRGYTWRGRVLRYAEVQAVRSGLPPAVTPDDRPVLSQAALGTNSTASSPSEPSS